MRNSPFEGTMTVVYNKVRVDIRCNIEYLIKYRCDCGLLLTEALEIIICCLAPLRAVALEVILVSLHEIPSVLVQELETTSNRTILVSRNNHSFKIFSACKNKVDWGASVIVLELSNCTRIIIALFQGFP